VLVEALKRAKEYTGPNGETIYEIVGRTLRHLTPQDDSPPVRISRPLVDEDVLSVPPTGYDEMVV
jgi:hypothetical protein